ncbi:hypothetical protein HAX54_052245 [Datura stramonium]|uniref:Uncharacterized protein n=1 Tax=Datura stramonium TaxID=4076 RepID=A0ABS8WND3_DATST|nr:hypothetical protein [Datura stramonium]
MNDLTAWSLGINPSLRAPCIADITSPTIVPTSMAQSDKVDEPSDWPSLFIAFHNDLLKLDGGTDGPSQG